MTPFLLADDLSGALDAAAAFHHAGWRVRIVLEAEAWPAAAPGEMVAFTTETRNAPPGVAAAAVARALELARARGATLVYKKIDSTLRGPVAAELQALTSIPAAARVLFAPANPSVGRTVRGGVLLVTGVPVAETDFGRDPVSPVKESVIRRLLGAAATDRVTIADAETEADLVAAVAAMDADGSPWVAVGSGALARPVAARLKPAPPRPATVASSRPSGPVLMLCGSAHARNREQAAVLSASAAVELIEARLADVSAAVHSATAALRQGKSAAVLIEASRHPDSQRVVQTLADAASSILDASGVRRVFVTGGETAFALCQRLGVATLAFTDELEPGLSLSSVGPWRFAIKPGGFGDRDTWQRAWRALSNGAVA